MLPILREGEGSFGLLGALLGAFDRRSLAIGGRLVVNGHRLRNTAVNFYNAEDIVFIIRVDQGDVASLGSAVSHHGIGQGDGFIMPLAA